MKVGGASRLERHPACCHTTLTNTDFRTSVALLAIIEDVPTFDHLSCTNQQDGFSDILCRCLHSRAQLHPAASLINRDDFSGLSAMYLRTCRCETWLTLSSDCAFQPILQSLCYSLVQPKQRVAGQTIDVSCHCTVAELQDRLISLENSRRICFLSHEHRPLWNCDTCLMLPNRPYHGLAQMALSSCLVAEFNRSPCYQFHCCVIVKLSVPCKPIANTRLGLATSSIAHLSATFSNMTSSDQSLQWSSCSFRSHSSSYEHLRN